MTPISFDPFSEAQRANPYPPTPSCADALPCIASRPRATTSSRATATSASCSATRSCSRRARCSRCCCRPSFRGAGTPGMGFSGADAARLVELMHALPISLPELLGSRSLIASDPPAHGPDAQPREPRLHAAPDRRARAARSAPSRARRSTPSRARASSTSCHDFSIPLPVTVIAELLGVEPERHADFKRWSDCIDVGHHRRGGRSAPRDPARGLQGADASTSPA